MRLAVRKDARCPRSCPFGLVDVDTTRLLGSFPTKDRAAKAGIRATLRAERPDIDRNSADKPHYVKLGLSRVEKVAGQAASEALDAATEADVRRTFLQAVARLQQSTQGQKILTALYGKDAPAAYEGLDWPGWTAALDGMKAKLADRAQAAAHATVVEIKPGLTARFGGDMAKAGDRAARMVGEHIVGIDDRTRAAVRDVISQGLRDGTSIPDLVKNLQGSVGLTPGDAKALDRFEKNLITQGTEPARIRMMVVEKRDRYLTSRATSIARTETLSASNAGRLDGYAYAAANGAIGTDAEKEWVIAPEGCCDLCADLDGEKVGISEPFSSGDDAPPLHPGCRCTTVLADVGTVLDEGEG